MNDANPNLIRAVSGGQGNPLFEASSSHDYPPRLLTKLSETLLLPERWPDETIYSLLARIARVNGIDHLEAVSLLLGEKNPISVIDCPVNIKHFSEATRGVYGSPQELLFNSTVLPMQVQLGEINPAEILEIENGVRHPELVRLVFGSGKGCRWRLCRECAAQDVKAYGIAYWRRVHQLPTSLFCPEHELILDRFDLHRMQLHEHLILPYELANEMKVNCAQAIPERNDRLYLDISILGRDALEDNSVRITSRVIKDVFKDRLNRMGLLNKRGKLSWQDYLCEFGRKFRMEASVSVMMRQSRVSTPKQLLFGIADSRSSRPFARMLLVYWFFDTWGAFKEQCRWQDILSDDSVCRAQEEGNKDGHGAAAILQQKRKICLDYKAVHARPTRREFQRESYRTFRWLLHNDRMWLDVELPLPPRDKRQGDFFS